QCMLVGELGVLVDEPSCHREMPRDLLGVLLAEGLQLVAGRTVQILAGDLRRDLRIVVAGTVVGLTVRTLTACATALRKTASTARAAGVSSTVVASRCAVALRVAALATIAIAARRGAITSRCSTITALVAALATVAVTAGCGAITAPTCGGRAVGARPPRAVVAAVVGVITASRATLILVRHVLILSTSHTTQNGHPALGGHFV